MKKKFWEWFAWHIAPKECLYSCVITAWAKATTEKYTDKSPGEVTWDMVCRHLDE